MKWLIILLWLVGFMVTVGYAESKSMGDCIAQEKLKTGRAAFYIAAFFVWPGFLAFWLTA